MKNILIISIIVIALFALAGAYVYRQAKIPAPLPFYGTSLGAMGAQNLVITPTPTQAPPLNQIGLSVTSPVNNAVVTNPKVTVSGHTVPGADVGINDMDIKADTNGNFSTTITLDEGENTIDVIASDADGNASEQMLTVTYNPPGQ